MWGHFNYLRVPCNSCLLRYLVFRWPFFNLFYLLSKWHFLRYPLSFPLSFDISVTWSARSCLPRTWEIDVWRKERKKAADSRCFFSSCFAYYFEKLTLLKNRFQMFCLFGSKSECVAQPGEVEYCLNKQIVVVDESINYQEQFAFFF